MWEVIDNWYTYFIVGFVILLLIGLGYEVYKDSNKDE